MADPNVPVLAIVPDPVDTNKIDFVRVEILLQTVEMSNKYPPLRPIHDSAMRELVAISKVQALAWSEIKDEYDAKVVKAKADYDAAVAKAAAAAAAPGLKRTIPPATV